MNPHSLPAGSRDVRVLEVVGLGEQSQSQPDVRRGAHPGPANSGDAVQIPQERGSQTPQEGDLHPEYGG